MNNADITPDYQRLIIDDSPLPLIHIVRLFLLYSVSQGIQVLLLAMN